MDWIFRKEKLDIEKPGHYNQVSLWLKIITQSMESYRLKMKITIEQWLLLMIDLKEDQVFSKEK